MTREKNKRRERERNTGQSENRKWERDNFESSFF